MASPSTAGTAAWTTLLPGLLVRIVVSGAVVVVVAASVVAAAVVAVVALEDAVAAVAAVAVVAVAAASVAAAVVVVSRARRSRSKRVRRTQLPRGLLFTPSVSLVGCRIRNVPGPLGGRVTEGLQIVGTLRKVSASERYTRGLDTICGIMCSMRDTLAGFFKKGSPPSACRPEAMMGSLVTVGS